MPHVPFPHVLIIPRESNNNVFHFVTPDEIEEGFFVQEEDVKQFNKNTEKMEMTYKTWKVNAIHEKRPARGTWTNWGCHPTFYSTTAFWVGIEFKLGQPINEPV